MMDAATSDRFNLWAHGFLFALGLCLALPAAASQPPGEDAAPRPVNEAAQPAVPIPAPDTGPEQQPQGTTPGGLSRQIELVTELASAYRVRREMESMLNEQGGAAVGVGDTTGTKLAGLATRCEVLSNSAGFDQTRVVLLNCQARVYAVLAQSAAGDTRIRRLRQLRAAAEQLASIDRPEARPASGYWLMLADLADTTGSSASLDARQALAERLLKDYIQTHASAPGANEYLVDARLSLANLMDQRGDQRGSAEQLDALPELPVDSPRSAEAHRLRSRAERIGRPVELEAVTTGLNLWRLSDHAGQPVLLHVYADAVEPSVAMIQALQRRIATQVLGGFAVASLRVGEPIAGSASPPWPTLPINPERGGVLDRLGVDALPTLVWIDDQGRLASIGYTLAVLDQFPRPEPQPESDDPAQPSPEPRAPVGGDTPRPGPPGSAEGTGD